MTQEIKAKKDKTEVWSNLKSQETLLADKNFHLNYFIKMEIFWIPRLRAELLNVVKAHDEI